MKKKQKKKGPKINNKLFSDMNLQEDMFQNAEPLPPQIQLEVKPKQSRGLSSKASSFLNKTDQLKKIRSIDNVSKDDQYEKILAAKAKQSIVKMVKQKQLEQVQQIELDVKVPNITKGRSSGQLNNSMYFRKFSQNLQRIQSQKINPSPIKSTQDQVSKLSRKQLFNSLMNDMKSRKSQNITYQLIAKSFKTTQLQQVQQIRKKNAEKRRQKALRGSDDQDFSDQQSGNNNKNEIQQQNKDNNNNNDSNQSQVQQNIHKMVDQNDNNKDEIYKQQKQKQIQRQAQNEETPKQQMNNEQQAHQNQEYTPKKFKICVQNQQQKPNPISDEQYNKLLQIQAGEIDEQDHDQIAQQLEIKDSNSDNDDQISEQNNDSNDQFSDNDDGFEDIDISQSQKVDIQVDVPASQSMNSQIQSEHKETNKRLKRNNFLIQSDQQQQHMLIQKNEEIVKQIKLSEIQNPQQYSDKQICIKIKPESLSQKQNILSEQIINKSHQDKIEDDQINKEYQHDKNSIKNNQNDEARQQFRKLRKLATIIKQKKVFQKKMKIASDMFEEEAQEGSDNQDHDGQVKLINYDQQNKQYEGLDLDADLQGFLQQAVDIDEQNEQKAFRKYLEDIKIQDREQLKKIINGDFKRNRPDYDNYNQQIDQDEQNRIKRMKEFQEYIRKKDEEDPQGRYIEDNQQGIDQAYNPNQMQEQVVDQMNQENLKKYLDDNLANNKLATMKILKPKKQLPQSYQRVKKLQKRNTMKNSKQQITNITNPNNIFLQNNIGASKLKKTTSHLNHQFMKNKQKLKTIGTLKTILMKRK